MRFGAVSLLFSLIPILLAACQGGGFVQPEAVGAAPEATARVEAIAVGSMRAGIGQIWGARGIKLFAGADETRTRATLRPGTYELLVTCDSPQGHSQQRIALLLVAGQKTTVHCAAGESGATKVVVRNLPGPASPGGKPQ